MCEFSVQFFQRVSPVHIYFNLFFIDFKNCLPTQLTKQIDIQNQLISKL